MKYSKSRFIFKINLIIFITSYCFSIYASKKHLRVGVPDLPPYYVIEDQLVVSGIHLPYLNKIMKRIPYSYSVKGMPIKRLYYEVMQGNIDVTFGIIPESIDFKKKVFVSEIPISYHGISIFTIGLSELPNSIDEMNSLELIIINGYLYGGEIKKIKDPSKKLILNNGANTHLAALKKLKGGQGKYFLGYYEPTKMALKEIKLPGLRYNILKVLKAYIIVSRKRGDGINIIKHIMNEHQKMKDEGIYLPGFNLDQMMKDHRKTGFF